MKKIILISAISCLGIALHADVLELKNGTVLSGTYSGGSSGIVNFTTQAGVQAIKTSDIISLTFTTPPSQTTPHIVLPPPAVPTQPTPAPVSQTVTVPAGTPLLVRMMDSVSSKNKAGSTFTTKLETDAGPLKAGTIVLGKVQSATEARRAVGQSSLDLRLTQAVVNNQSVPLFTSGYQEAGARSAGKAARGAAAGAAIGAIAGDAGKGAAIGAGAGALRKGETVTIAPGTLLEFTLMQPVTVPATQ